MKKIQLLGFLIIAFGLGWIAHNSEISAETETPFGMLSTGMTPNDWITQDKIHVYPHYIRIDLRKAFWANFTNTNSMIPVLSDKSNAIQIKPTHESQIHTGDIISYKPEGRKKRIIHRVVGIGQDSEGRYFITKGDNNQYDDPFKVRFEDIERVVVAVIY